MVGRGGTTFVGSAGEAPPLDRRDHRAVLLLHQAADPLLVDAAFHLLRVRGLLRRQDLAAHVHQALDVRILQTFVLGLDVVDLLVMLDIGVEPRDHGRCSGM